MMRAIIRPSVAARFVAALMTVLIPIVAEAAEPTFKGKNLSEWTAQYHGGGETLREEAKVALQAIGTNAFPSITRKLKSHDIIAPGIRRKVVDIAPNLGS